MQVAGLLTALGQDTSVCVPDLLLAVTWVESCKLSELSFHMLKT